MLTHHSISKRNTLTSKKIIFKAALVIVFVLFNFTLESTPETLKCSPLLKSIKLKSLETRDSQVIEKLKTLIKQGKNFHMDCPAELVSYGLLKSAEYVIENYFISQKINIEQNFRFSANSMKAKLNSLLKLSLSSSETITTPPAFKWAQSFGEVVLLIKFAARLDAPGCLDLSSRSITIEEDSLPPTNITNITHADAVPYYKIPGQRLKLEARGILAGTSIRFLLDIPLYLHVERASLEVKSEGVGSVMVRVKKVNTNVIWAHLRDRWRDQKRKDLEEGSGAEDLKGFKGDSKGGVKYKEIVWWDIPGKEYSFAMNTFKKIYSEEDDGDDIYARHNRNFKRGQQDGASSLVDGISSIAIGLISFGFKLLQSLVKSVMEMVNK